MAQPTKEEKIRVLVEAHEFVERLYEQMFDEKINMPTEEDLNAASEEEINECIRIMKKWFQDINEVATAKGIVAE